MNKKIYLDYAATTPVDKEVLKAMSPYFSEKFGNPGSLHSFGQEALKAIDESREKIAKAIGAPPVGGFREIIFTGSATEANNLALRGIVKAFSFELLALRNEKNNLNLTANSYELKPRIIISSIEHESILETCRDLEKNGIEIIYLPVDKSGLVDLKKLKESLNERTILVSIMYANNEIGTIQPISAIAEIVRKFRMQNAELRKNNSKVLIHNSELAMALPLLHTDAVQAFQFLDCDVNKLGVDLMTLSAHKIYGPKGIGLLYSRIKNAELRMQNFNKNLSPIITGGGQEFGLRSGTENVPAIVGLGKAIELASKIRESETKRLIAIKDYFLKNLQKIYPQTTLNSPKENLCSPHIANIYFPNRRSEDLLIKLDLAGIAVSSGAACSARAMKPSYVLKAIGLAEQKIKSSLRFSFGKFTTKKEIEEALKIIKKPLI